MSASSVVLGQLDASARAVVTDAEHAVAERLHRELGAVDLREHHGIHFGAVRDARRETRRRGLLGARHAELAGELALPRPCRRRPRAVGGRRRAPAAAVRPGRQSPTSSAFAPDSTAAISTSRRERCELVVELRLAVVAAVATVRPVALALELGGRDRLVPDADRARDVARAVELARRERGRHRGHGERPVAERACGERRDE